MFWDPKSRSLLLENNFFTWKKIDIYCGQEAGRLSMQFPVLTQCRENLPFLTRRPKVCLNCIVQNVKSVVVTQVGISIRIMSYL